MTQIAELLLNEAATWSPLWSMGMEIYVWPFFIVRKIILLLISESYTIRIEGQRYVIWKQFHQCLDYISVLKSLYS